MLHRVSVSIALCPGATAVLAEAERVLVLQTAMRVWDALLSEGAKILYRVALALLKTHEDRLMAQDNAGYVQREMKLASAGMHDRDALMKVWTARPDTNCPHCCSRCCIASLQSAGKPTGQVFQRFFDCLQGVSWFLHMSPSFKRLFLAYRSSYGSQSIVGTVEEPMRWHACGR